MNLNRILVGIDGSDSAQAAAAWAADLAVALDAHLIAVHGFARHPMLSTDTNDSLYATEQEDFAREWCRVVEDSEASFELVMEVGDPRDLLLTVAVRERVDLIVVGSRGHSPVTQLLLGSVADYLTHHAPVPVTIVRG